MKNGENREVLVVDSDKVVRQDIAAYLSDNEYRVVQADDCDEAIASFHSSCPAIVIFDINLPGGKALETLEHIFALSPTQPVLILSEPGHTEEVIQAMRLGVSKYLVKPIEDMELLLISIENSLQGYRLIEQNIVYRKNLEEINRELEDRVEVFQMDQQAGRHVQMSMLPKPPQDINGFHFDHKVIPSLYLSGDSVDYKPVSSSKVLFYIGDVSGHGSSSAFVTVLLRFRIAQMLREHIQGRFRSEFTPAAILDLLNHDLMDTALDKHITVCMGVLDKRDFSLDFSIAGHHPLPVLYSEGKARFIEPSKSSFPIGLNEQATYFNETIMLPQDFALFLFSDGILEYLPGENMTKKEERLLQVISECKGNFQEVKTGLHLRQDIKVPDDIAVLSASNL